MSVDVRGQFADRIILASNVAEIERMDAAIDGLVTVTPSGGLFGTTVGLQSDIGTRDSGLGTRDLFGMSGTYIDGISALVLVTFIMHAMNEVVSQVYRCIP